MTKVTEYREEDCPLCGGIGEVDVCTVSHPNGESVGCPHCIQMQLEAEIEVLNIKISVAHHNETTAIEAIVDASKREAAAIAAWDTKSKALEEAIKTLQRIAMNISGDTCAQVVAGEALRSVNALEGGAA